ncbi:hypothetical protein PR048_028645 [Dryococelus australis]|uniref:Reverse transcriptase RNase H-like domain-containing protein n=1 Tax=Dryococelus australis TaxID=614101 RepID=A0ABQ9GDT4_9NEOP|nr:hypothetical protein PR048_028645 [Dryococelus australis]
MHQIKGWGGFASRKATGGLCKELLAILFGCKWFQHYPYGNRVEVETDHKPLEGVLNKPLDKCPLHLQHMWIKLQNYDIQLKHVPGKYLVVAYALSRAICSNENIELHEKEIAAQEGLHIQASNDMLAKIKTHTEG